MTTKWQETTNGVRTMQSIARNLEKLTGGDPITPRDLFAAVAMQAELLQSPETAMVPKDRAEWCFVAADAMMKARDA